MKVKISSKGQICLPAGYRKRLNIGPGDHLTISESGDHLILIPAKKVRDRDDKQHLFDELKGIWSHLERDGADLVRDMRKGGTRDVWE